ncbi:MAG: hypothetical protein HOP19_28855, partial [Acidobacteria bacterium]|nr:hypothetical protein [Acidobacteriota bacterium]
MEQEIRRAIIGDADTARVNDLQNFLKEEFALEIECKPSYKLLREALTQNEWAIVFVAADLPFEINGRSLIQPRHFQQLRLALDARQSVNLVRIRRGYEPKLSAAVATTIDLVLPALLANENIRALLTHDLEEQCGLRRKPRRPKLSWDSAYDRDLRRQLLRLGTTGNLDKGQEILEEVIGELIECEQFTAKPHIQGKSGASVFRIVTKIGTRSTGKFLLKLVNGRDDRARLGLKREIQGYQAAEGLLRSSQNLINNMAPLLKPKSPKNPQGAGNEYVVSSGQWDAIHYQFLEDEKLGEFLDLETA